jgi:seryl-tRNA synthetase
MNEVLDKAELPKKYAAFSHCFKREAGDTHGSQGSFAMEQVVLCEASHQESVQWHEGLMQNTEELIQSLGIPYRVMVNCGGDLGLGQVKKYTIELWVPKEKKYRAVGSASYFHDFQTRRLNIRYRDEKGIVRFAHSLHVTALSTPQLIVSLVENFQCEDGSILVPEVLRGAMNKDVIEKSN